MQKRKDIIAERLFDYFYNGPWLFSKADDPFKSAWRPRERTETSHSIEEVVEECKIALAEIDHKTVFLQMTLLMKAVLEYGIEFKRDNEALELKYQLSPAIYTAFDGMFSLAKNMLKQIRFPNKFFQGMVTETTDPTTWRFTDPKYLATIIEKMQEQNYNPDVIVGLANGAMRASYMLGTVIGAEVIPIRFSRLKKKDQIPRLFVGEEEVLEQMLSEKNVLIYDEDSWKGKGLFYTKMFLQQFNPQNIKTAVSGCEEPSEIDYIGTTFGSSI